MSASSPASSPAIPTFSGTSFTRSLINRSIGQAIEIFGRFGLRLPEYALWTPADWERERGNPALEEVRDCMLGWDVTDFGGGDFPRIGRTLFTLRNGNARDPRYRKVYAEKYILDPEGQRAPAHFHLSKMEDIINRGGGEVVVVLAKATDDNRKSAEPLEVRVDGVARRVAAGEPVRLRPGQSLMIPPRTVHQFWGEKGWTVSGEVSSVCDDRQDNFFLEEMTRFPVIVEDEPREFYLCHEYPRQS